MSDFYKSNHDRQVKLLKMLNNKMTRNLLVENEVINLNYIGKLNALLKNKDENEFYQVVSKLVLNNESVAVFTFDSIEIRLNVFRFTEPGAENRESFQFFSFVLLEEFNEQVFSDEQMMEWLDDGVIILDI
ncbi:hypothetical protein A9Q74_16500 [Colwellia sp. 39_35_sub15_T18]|nr:hypothetical protein A9Q74_16500 [Colwellia sp. 39_35_sub15_T18]